MPKRVVLSGDFGSQVVEDFEDDVRVVTVETDTVRLTPRAFGTWSGYVANSIAPEIVAAFQYASYGSNV